MYKIRRRVVQFIIDNIDSFRDDIQLNLNSLTVDQYLLNMLQTDGSRSSWADSGILKNLAASCGLQLQVTSSLFKDDGTKFEVICFSDVYSGIFELLHDCTLLTMLYA
jgi:hypothetical protein